MTKKSKKSMRLNKKVTNILGNRPAIFAVAFAVLGVGLILITHASTPFTNPATKTYNVTLPPADCIHTKSGGCSPIPGTEGLKLYGPSNKSASYVIKNVGPGRYNLDFSYSIPQIIGVNDYGHLNYSVIGSIVNIGQPTTGSRHFALYGKATSATTAPLTATETFTSFGVKWPKSDIRITISYTNNVATTLRMTAIQLRPQKSNSGWTCGATNDSCHPSPDYQYYFPPGSNPSSSHASSSSSSSQPATTNSSSAISSSTPRSNTQSQKTEFKKNGKKQSSQPKLDSSQEEPRDCSQGNIAQQAYCHARSAIDSFFSHF